MRDNGYEPIRHLGRPNDTVQPVFASTDVNGLYVTSINITFEVLTSDLIFGQTVGAGQDIHILGLGFGIGGIVQVNQPLSFSASVTLQSTSTPVFGAGSPEIDLIGLAHADSYSFQHDMLSIFSGNSVIDTLHMHDGTLYGFVVQQTSAGVSVIGIDDPANPPPGGLPIHT